MQRIIDSEDEILFALHPVKKLTNRALLGVQKTSLILAISLLGRGAFAQLSSSDPLTVSVMKGEQPQQIVSGQLRFETMKYFTALPEAPNLTYSEFLYANVAYHGSNDWMEGGYDIAAGTFFYMNQSNLMVHELYAGTKTDGYKVYAGRKKYAWSEMDRTWKLGLWQPYYELDALRPEEEGLTGVFLDIDRDGFGFVMFATPIFIPTMGPDIHNDNGALVSDSRWYRTPSRQADFADTPNTINYNLTVPQTAELVKNGGYAMMGRLGNKEQGPWMVASAGYKPVNDLILKRQIFRDIENPEIGVTVSPDVTYHSIFSTDIGITEGKMKYFVSYLEDNPQEKLPPDDWAIQRLDGLQAYSAEMDWDVTDYLTRTMILGVGYLKVNGGQIQDIVHDGSPDDITLYDQRLKFTNAFVFKAEGELFRLFHRPLRSRFAWMYDSDQRGSMMNTEFQYFPTREWAVLMGADFLGVDDENYKPSGFLNQFRANDRVYGGLSYVF